MVTPIGLEPITPESKSGVLPVTLWGNFGLQSRIRTYDLLNPNQVFYQTELSEVFNLLFEGDFCNIF